MKISPNIQNRLLGSRFSLLNPAQSSSKARTIVSIYIKESSTSRLLEAFSKIDPFERKPRHFLFVGMDYCYQTLGLLEPVIHEFPDEKQAKPPAPKTPVQNGGKHDAVHYRRVGTPTNGGIGKHTHHPESIRSRAIERQWHYTTRTSGEATPPPNPRNALEARHSQTEKGRP
jgi:hypothetical protein